MAAGRERSLGWRDDALDFRVDVDGDGMARITRLAAPGTGRSPAHGDAALPLLDVVLAGEGKVRSGGRYCESEAGGRFRYQSHGEGLEGSPWRELRVELADPVSGLRAEVYFATPIGKGVLRSWVRLTNRGRLPVTLESVTSFLCGGLSSGAAPDDTGPDGADPDNTGPDDTGPDGADPDNTGPDDTGPDGAGPDDLRDLDVLWAENDWLAEARWQRRELRDALPDLNRRVHGGDAHGRFGLTSTGSWSSGTYLPMGAVLNRRTGHAWAWQVEHNGAWHWQVGECSHHRAMSGPRPAGWDAPPGSVTGAYLALLGPADAEHHWRTTLEPGDAFTTVPVTVVVSPAGFEGAVAALTACRRAIRRPHEDHRALPVIFNDYMNTLMGNPTTERLLPLVTAAAEAGAEYFCIDSGWYAEIDQGWWDTVGAWKPAASRFPNGIVEVLDHIRAAGMVPGLWLEPEVVGVNSPVVRQLPPEAFLRRGGRLIVEHGRYHLDLRHPAAVRHVDGVVDFAVRDLGAGYLKLDYNIAVCPGPDTGNLSPGAGLLAVNRAHLAWLDGVLDRHPGLIIENCSSGGMRIDYAMLSRLQVQSTSDQQDHLRYPPIAAAAPTAMTPEQAGVWAYPQPSFTDDEITFTLCGALLGRVQLSGHLDRMSPAQRELVAAAVRAYKSIRSDLAAAMPFWPLGLPRWTDSWIALGMRAPAASYLTVWHRGALGAAGADPADPGEVSLPVPHLRGRPTVAKLLYPDATLAAIAWDPADGNLSVSLPRTPTACLIMLPH